MKTVGALCLLACLSLASAFSFNILPGQKVCFYELIEEGAPVSIMFQMISGTSNGCAVSITAVDEKLVDPNIREIHHNIHITNARYTFIANDKGLYSFCFSNNLTMSTTMTMSLVLRVGNAPETRDDNHVKGVKPPLAREIDDLAEGVLELLDEQEYMKMRERAHRDTSELTNAKVVWWAFFEFAMLLGMSFWQIYFVRRLFERKRVI